MMGELGSVVVDPGLGGFEITGYSFNTGVGTYNPGGYGHGGETHGEPAARFWLKKEDGDSYQAHVAFSIRGAFDVEGSEEEHARMIGCYLYATESSGLSDDVRFKIEATPLEQAAGTGEDPRVRFECVWSVDLSFDDIADVEASSCGGSLLLEVNRYGHASFVEESTWGLGRVTATPGGTFHLEFVPDGRR
jgi:hypothetical protein